MAFDCELHLGRRGPHEREDKTLRPGSDAALFMRELYSNLDRLKLTKVHLLIQTSNLISRSTAVPNTVTGKLINIVSGSILMPCDFRVWMPSWTGWLEHGLDLM